MNPIRPKHHGFRTVIRWLLHPLRYVFRAVPDEDVFDAECERPSGRDLTQLHESTMGLRSEIISGAVTYLTTVHTAGTFGVLAIWGADRSLAQSSALQGAVAYFLFGLLLVGVYIALVWHQNEHQLRSEARSLWFEFWPYLNRLFSRLRALVIYASFIAFVLAALLIYSELRGP